MPGEFNWCHDGDCGLTVPSHGCPLVWRKDKVRTEGEIANKYRASGRARKRIGATLFVSFRDCGAILKAKPGSGGPCSCLATSGQVPVQTQCASLNTLHQGYSADDDGLPYMGKFRAVDTHGVDFTPPTTKLYVFVTT